MAEERERHRGGEFLFQVATQECLGAIEPQVGAVARIDEAGNDVRKRSRAIERRLLDRGLSADKAALLAAARVFVYPAGQYGTPAYYYLVKRSGDWDTREQLMDAYLAQVENVYTTGMWGEQALTSEFRVRLFNRKWIEGMKREGYAGADQVAVMVSNAMGWAIMREGSVSDDTWREIKEVYLDDKLNLSLREWFEKENPFAFQEMLEVLLESARKGYWKVDTKTLSAVARAYVESVAKHGEGQGLRGGGNTKLTAYVGKAASAPGAAKSSVAGTPPRVVGRKLAPIDDRSPSWLTLPVGIAVVSVLLVAFGFARRRRR